MFAMIDKKTNKLYTTFAALNSIDMRTTKKTSHHIIKGKEVPSFETASIFLDEALAKDFVKRFRLENIKVIEVNKEDFT